MKNNHKHDLTPWFILIFITLTIFIVIRININIKNSKVEIEDYIPKPELTLDDSIGHNGQG